MTPIGIFDSRYGGLTILRQIRHLMPQYDYLYLGDNARAPYGTRSFEVVYEFTLQAVKRLFQEGCPLVILACNTASAKALRSIQQNDLPIIDPSRRVLGVVRPTAEIVGGITKTNHIGVFATPGTVRSNTYELEIAKLHPELKVTGVACPMWVPLVENNEAHLPGADYFVKRKVEELLAADPLIDTVILGCTHYPILLDKIKEFMPQGINIIPQGQYVADSLQDYLTRHSEMQQVLSQNGTLRLLTTEQPSQFNENASIFLNNTVEAQRIILQ